MCMRYMIFRYWKVSEIIFLTKPCNKVKVKVFHNNHQNVIINGVYQYQIPIIPWFRPFCSISFWDDFSPTTPKKHIPGKYYNFELYSITTKINLRVVLYIGNTPWSRYKNILTGSNNCGCKDTFPAICLIHNKLKTL